MLEMAHMNILRKRCLDAFSLRQKLGDLSGNQCRHRGRHSAFPGSDQQYPVLEKLGANVRVCGPKTLIPKHIATMGVEVSHDLDDTLHWCDVANMLRIQMERQGENSVPYFPSIARIRH